MQLVGRLRDLPRSYPPSRLRYLTCTQINNVVSADPVASNQLVSLYFYAHIGFVFTAASVWRLLYLPHQFSGRIICVYVSVKLAPWIIIELVVERIDSNHSHSVQFHYLLGRSWKIYPFIRKPAAIVRHGLHLLFRELSSVGYRALPAHGQATGSRCRCKHLNIIDCVDQPVLRLQLASGPEISPPHSERRFARQSIEKLVQVAHAKDASANFSGARGVQRTPALSPSNVQMFAPAPKGLSPTSHFLTTHNTAPQRFHPPARESM